MFRAPFLVILAAFTLAGCAGASDGDVQACEDSYEAILDYERATIYGYVDGQRIYDVMNTFSVARRAADDEDLRDALGKLSESTSDMEFKNAKGDVIDRCGDLDVDLSLAP